jgi:16S rRNA (guanine527-N7)-methyltransferase
MIALKGQLPQAEIDVLPTGWNVSKIQEITVPGLDVQRHLVWVRRVN